MKTHEEHCVHLAEAAPQVTGPGGRLGVPGVDGGCHTVGVRREFLPAQPQTIILPKEENTEKFLPSEEQGIGFLK